MLYLAIGRNVEDTPMSLQDWVSFRTDVQTVMFDCERQVDADTKALGESNFGGMPEETFVLVWFDINQDLSEVTKRELSKVARKYGQESIAYSVSVTNFVEA